jgi:hypothetical protein
MEEKYIEVSDTNLSKVVDVILKCYPGLNDISFLIRDKHLYLYAIDGAQISMLYVKVPIVTNIDTIDLKAPWNQFNSALKKVSRTEKLRIIVGDQLKLTITSITSNFTANIDIPLIDEKSSEIKGKSPVDALDAWKFDEQFLVSMEHFKKMLTYFGSTKDEKISFSSTDKKVKFYTHNTDVFLDRTSGILVEPHEDFKESSFSYDFFSRLGDLLGEAILIGISRDGNYPLFAETDLNKEIFCKHILAPRIGD